MQRDDMSLRGLPNYTLSDLAIPYFLFCVVKVVKSAEDAKSRSSSIDQVTDPVQHSEGPFWHAKTQELYFVDTFKSTIYRWNYKDKKTQSYRLENHKSVGVIIPIKDKEDHFVVAADRNVYKLYWPSGNKTETKLEHLTTVDKDKPTNQFNDGKADSNGRLWLGTLTRNEDLSVAPAGGSLYLIPGQNLTAEEKEISLSISNGLDWCNEEKKLYHIDSQTRKVAAYDFDKVTGHIQNKKIIFDLQDHPNLGGIPDGMAADEYGNLWIALFGGASIIKIDPNTGGLLETIRMPVKYCTSLCFGGPGLTTLFVTTSRLKLNEKELSQNPNAGSVFAITNLGVKGRIMHEALI